MKSINPDTRRGFLARSLSAGAACALARVGTADEVQSTPQNIRALDTHVYVGRWPFARLPGDEPANLVGMLREHGVTTAWTGNFDGLFHKDIASVNERLAHTCAKFGDGILKPLGTVNPTLPDWENDVRRCHETFHFSGIQLHPNYHGYTLDDPRFARLLDLATDHGLAVHLIAWLEDEPRKWLRPREAEVDLKPLARTVSKIPNAKVVIANGVRSARDDVFQELARLEQVSFDFGRLSDPDDFDQLIAATSAKRIVFGSGAPLYPISQAAN